MGEKWVGYPSSHFSPILEILNIFTSAFLGGNCLGRVIFLRE